jgi:fructose-1,6-bisphosphatase
MICSRCGESKTSSDFYKSDLKCRWCKKCRYAYNKANRHKFRERDKAYSIERRKRHPEKVKLADRRSKLKKAYGLTVEQVDQMAKDQNFLCLICRQRKPLVVDHNHETNVVSGLLCGGCNVGLGAFGENVAALESAIRYLAKSN